ncbi:nucleotidyltransferase domain-containing protein [Methanorbis furvi]|uniref:Polymerase nucleotidyl transferase domain-containing protein n=1 Tax=Methanorbis furvi TaxID=3028299 RepID=A0AAE4MB40_9EURY|nr:hypothetical protein [Methanocorpusculaceae archaeon Ag1]
MIETQSWMNELTAKLLSQFGERLIFAGLQGSYLRNEATEESDIDVMVILDELALADLAAYKTIVAKMPEGEKACGFICGKEELLAWPKHELFQLAKETKNWHGELAQLLPPVTRENICDSVKISAANLYHEACHRYLYDQGDNRVENLQYAYKTSSFLLKLVHYLRTYEYITTRKDLLTELSGIEQEILLSFMNWDGEADMRQKNPGRNYQQLISWTGALLREMQDASPEIRITVQAQ